MVGIWMPKNVNRLKAVGLTNFEVGSFDFWFSPEMGV